MAPKPDLSDLDPTTQAILEALQARATEFGDEFEPKANRVVIRCYQPGKHQNADSHPSATYTFAKYLVCPVCGFKKGQKALAEMLGIGLLSGGLTLPLLAEAKVKVGKGDAERDRVQAEPGPRPAEGEGVGSELMNQQ